MRLLKRKSYKVTSGRHLTEKLKERIGRSAELVRQRWADWMQRRYNRLSQRAKCIGLIIFCLSAASGSIYIAAKALFSSEHTSFHIHRIKTPVRLRPEAEVPKQKKV